MSLSYSLYVPYNLPAREFQVSCRPPMTDSLIHLARSWLSMLAEKHSLKAVLNRGCSACTAWYASPASRPSLG